LLRDETMDQAVVFTATKRDADTIADRLNIAGFAAAALHGDMHQGARNRTLDGLRRGNVKVLVATDVAARGIDVPNITHVFNYDLPKFPEDYVHRIGRTGRAGRNGLAVSLVNHAENMLVRRIERLTRQPIPVEVVEGFEPKRAAPARSASRPGWKPGDGRNAKPDQRSFSKPRTEGGHYRSENNPFAGERSEGGYRNRNEGGFRAEGGFRSERAEGGFRNRNEGGFRSERPAEGGFRNRSEGALRSERPAEGGFRNRADGGGFRTEGGFRERGESSFRRDREAGGGFKGPRPDAPRRPWGDR
jgi:superfamily II DNA/RNA helicase